MPRTFSGFEAITVRGRRSGPIERSLGFTTLELEPYRGELTAHCYRMLGSFHDAEDVVQETLLRAWAARDRFDPGRASERTWLYRIATNACLTALQGRARRPLPSGLGAPSDNPGAALTPAAEISWLGPFPDARLDVAVRTDLRLSLVAALQTLPPRQRAVLILREVLDFPAADVAQQLGTTVAAVNSALQRARSALAGVTSIDEIAEPDDPDVRATIERYVRAFEAADVAALVALLAEDAVLEMPPVPLWYRGRGDYGRFIQRVFELRGPGWRMRRAAANGQPALAAYAPGDDALVFHSLQIFSLRCGQITRNVVFTDPGPVGLFGLPQQIESDYFSRER